MEKILAKDMEEKADSTFGNSLIAVSLLGEIAQAISKSGPESALRFLLESAISISEAQGAILFIPHEKLREMVPMIEYVPSGIDRRIWEGKFSQFLYKVYLEDIQQILAFEEIPEKLPEIFPLVEVALAMPVHLASKSIALLFIFKGPLSDKSGKSLSISSKHSSSDNLKPKESMPQNGTKIIDNDRPEIFSRDQMQFFGILTPFMGTLIENSRLQTEMIHKNSRLSSLYEISQKAESIIDLRDVYDSLEGVVRSFTDCDTYTIYFLSSDGSSLETRIAGGSPFVSKIPLGQGPVGLAAKDLKPHLTYSEEFKSILILPVIVSGKLIGVVVLASRKSYAYRDEDIIGLRIIITQIASIDEMFKNLLRLRGFTEAILQTMTAGVLIFDDNRHLTFSNSAMARLIGQPTPKGWSPVSDEISFPAKLRDMILGVLEKRISFENERVFLDEFEPPRTIEINAFPFRDESSITLGTAFFFRDITQSIRMEERLKRTDRLSALGILAAGVAHEIRNPLTGMKMIVQLLTSEFPENDPKREPLGIIQKEIDRLERLIVNLLDFAKPNRVTPVKVDLPEIIEGCLVLIRNQINKHGLRLEKNFPEQIPSIIGDPDQLKQVFLNILTNAIQAAKPPLKEGSTHLGSPHGGGSGKISVIVETRQNFVVASISDTGIGIPMDRQKIIFDPFVTTKDDGTGLGLSVALRIIEEHGGRIEVESAEGAGAKFSVYFPIKTETK